jgi:hypothetical protein
MDTLGTVPPGTDAMKDCQARTRKINDAIEDVGWAKPEEVSFRMPLEASLWFVVQLW